MTENVVDLARARVEKAGDSRQWTPLECLKAVVADIEAGVLSPDMIYIAMRESDGPMARYPCAVAGMTRLESAGLLSRHQHCNWDADAHE